MRLVARWAVGRGRAGLAPGRYEHDELRVPEVAARLDVARSTAHRILVMLVFEGFAEQDRHKVYQPGPVLRAIRGSRAAPPPDRSPSPAPTSGAWRTPCARPPT
ncbi:helix-turn-helix domain-containing protein [Streptomyces qaidamensis]|uniref:helix-turn-helix domain-containing protein n=1 Tax=Streptomyces qaidamensis TaxID=1783515 RepID=UPI0036E9E748